MSSNMHESSSQITAHALIFIGQLVTIAGALALLRTGEKSLFYAALMPIGLIATGWGFWLRHRLAKQSPTNGTSDGQG